MKKILPIILVALLLSLCFVPTVFATAAPTPEIKYVSFSDDFKTMYYEDKAFSRIDSTEISYYQPLEIDIVPETVVADMNDTLSQTTVVEDSTAYYEYNYRAYLNDKQLAEVKNVYISVAQLEIIFNVEIRYKDGSVLLTSFLDNDYLEEQNKLINGEIDNYIVNFDYPQDNNVFIKKEVLISDEIHEFYFLQYDMTFNVIGYIDNGSLQRRCGEIHIIDDEFYYLDYNLNQDLYTVYYGNTYYGSFFYEEPLAKLYRITDEETVKVLKEALNRYYNDDMGYIYNNELQENVSKVFLTTLFGIIPLGSLVTFTVLTFKTKKKSYKKIYVTGCIVSLAEIIAFITSAICLFK